MTREEAIFVLECVEAHGLATEAKRMAIEALKAEPIVRCKDCKHFGEADSNKPEYHECKYFSDWVIAHYMLENDYCSCAERKDEVEEWTSSK